MASTVESVQPSTSNLINNPLIPTTITAEILVENIPSAAVAAATSVASTVSVGSNSGSLLAAISANDIEMHESEQQQAPSTAAAAENLTDKSNKTDEPDAKRRKIDNTSTKSKIVEKLEARLGGILCCAVCLDLPRTAMYQCPMGHLMCAACFTHLLADGRLRDQVATCPNCRVEISKQNASRNLAVEKAVSELPSQCQYCQHEYPAKSLEHHETNECDERPTDCKFARIGCQWKGPIHEEPEHEKVCIHPRKTGGEVMSALEDRDAKHAEEKKLFLNLVDLLSYEKIIFNDLQLKPYRTDEYVHKLYYETSKFSAFNHQWVVKASINNSQRDVHESSERNIAYQLILKSKTTCPLQINYFVLKGPFSDMKVNTRIYKHDFTDSENESKNSLLPLPDTAECNRHLASKAINFRLIMFLASK